VKAIIKVESNFNPRALSNKGAMGLMQLMPGTARSLNVTNPFDVNQNVDAGVRHFRQLLEDFKGDVKLSLAAYNAGERAVTSHGGIPPYQETQNYVRQITNLYSGGLTTRFATATHTPIKVYRDQQGVLTFNNVD
jgi:soluble lytic murein transglycosylase-like protein